MPTFTRDGRFVRFIKVRLGGFDFLQVPLDGSRVPRVWWTGPRPHPRPPASAASFTANGPSR